MIKGLEKGGGEIYLVTREHIRFETVWDIEMESRYVSDKNSHDTKPLLCQWSRFQ